MDAMRACTHVVLVADDEDAVRMLARLYLERQGYAVLAASDGLSALRLAAGCPVPVDLLVADMTMPGMDGPEQARRLADLHPEVKILFMSGYSGDALATVCWRWTPTSWRSLSTATPWLARPARRWLGRGTGSRSPAWRERARRPNSPGAPPVAVEAWFRRTLLRLASQKPIDCHWGPAPVDASGSVRLRKAVAAAKHELWHHAPGRRSSVTGDPRESAAGLTESLRGRNTTRKPRRLSQKPGTWLKRRAERQLIGWTYHEPPRRTRSSPVTTPAGSLIYASWYGL